jgi:hypothetical protein
MSRPQPPASEDVVEVSPEQIDEAIATLQAAEYPQKIQPAIRLAIASLKTLRHIYALLSMCRITVAQLRNWLGIRAPKKNTGDGDKDGTDVSPPDGDAPQPEPTAPKNGDEHGKGAATGSETEKAKDDKDEESKGRDDHGRRGKGDFPDAKERFFAHPDFAAPACQCPECQESKV